MELSKRQELKNYIELARTSIAHLYNEPGSAEDPDVRQKAWEILRQLRSMTPEVRVTFRL